MTEERPGCLRHREGELSIGQLEKDLVCQMLGKEDRALSTVGWIQVEALAGERAKVIMAAFGVGAANPCDTLEIVATGTKPLPDLLDTLKAVHAVGSGVLLIVVLAEIDEKKLHIFLTKRKYILECNCIKDTKPHYTSIEF